MKIKKITVMKIKNWDIISRKEQKSIRGGNDLESVDSLTGGCKRVIVGFFPYGEGQAGYYYRCYCSCSSLPPDTPDITPLGGDVCWVPPYHC